MEANSQPPFIFEPLSKYLSIVSAGFPKKTTLCHSVLSLISPDSLSFHDSVVAIERLATAELVAVYLISGSPKRIGPYAVTKTMGSTVSAILGTALKIKGVNYSISSACSTSAHCIGHAAELIQSGKQDMVIAGGGEDEHWTSSSMFDAMGALSSSKNDDPQKASRPFDKDRDGFVISGGAGIVILESEEHAKKRNANILAELKGYFAPILMSQG